MGQQASSRFKGEMTGGDCASALHRSQSQKWVVGGGCLGLGLGGVGVGVGVAGDILTSPAIGPQG